MSTGLKIGDTTYKIIASRPSGNYLQMVRGSDGLIRYAKLTTTKPSTTTLKFVKGSTTLYLNQPNHYVGVINSWDQHVHTLGTSSSSYNTYFDKDHTFYLPNSDQATLRILTNVSTRTICYSPIIVCDYCDSCSGSEGCGGSDRNRSYDIDKLTSVSKSDSLNTLIGSYEALINSCDHVEDGNSNLGIDDYDEVIVTDEDQENETPTFYAVSASPPGCYDSYNRDQLPSDGRKTVIRDSKDDVYPPYTEVIKIAETMFQPEYVGSVNFSYSVLLSNLGSDWVHIHSYYPFHNRHTDGSWYDHSYIQIQIFVRRVGTTVYVKRRLYSSIDQGSSGNRNQWWKSSVASSIGMYLEY
ncbi:MAG: hypothetical protein ACRCX2_16130 [Paraclostridium sp.]